MRDMVEQTERARFIATSMAAFASAPAAIVMFPVGQEPVLLAVTPKLARALRIGESHARDSEEARVRVYLQGVRGGYGIWMVREDGSSQRAEPRDIADMAYGAGWQRVDDRQWLAETAPPPRTAETLLMPQHGVSIDMNPVRLHPRHGWAPCTASSLLDLCLEDSRWAATWRRIGETHANRKGHVIHHVQVWWESDSEGHDRACAQCLPGAGATFEKQEEAQLRAIVAVETALREAEAGP